MGWRTEDFPVSNQAAAEVLSLPIFPGLTEAEVARVAGAVREFYAGARS